MSKAVHTIIHDSHDRTNEGHDAIEGKGSKDYVDNVVLSNIHDRVH